MESKWVHLCSCVTIQTITGATGLLMWKTDYACKQPHSLRPRLQFHTGITTLLKLIYTGILYETLRLQCYPSQLERTASIPGLKGPKSFLTWSQSLLILYFCKKHIKHNEHELLRCNWVSQVFQSTSHLFCETIPFKHISTICSGLIFSVCIMLLNVYGPNYDDPSFFRNIFNLLPNLSNTHLLVLEPILDRTLIRSVGHLLNSTTILNKLINSFDLVDIWRLKHPTDRQYTFSHIHNSYSRLDFFLIIFKDALCVTSMKHYNRIISDHSTGTISLDLFEIKPNYSWRFNPTLLLDTHFSKHVIEWLDDHLTFNDTGEVSISTLWESLKVLLRRHIISYESDLNNKGRHAGQ